MERKSEEQLRQQVDTAEEQMEDFVAPAGESERRDIFEMPVSELKEKHPKRYGIYLDQLRRARRDISEPEREEEARHWLGILNSLDDYIEGYKKEISDDPRHPVQQEVFGTLRDFLEQGRTHGYIKLPTGSGKSHIFKRFLDALHERSLIIVPGNVLLDQTVEHLSGTSLGEDLGVINQHSKDYSANSIVTTYASIIRNIKDGKLDPKEFSVVILDEAHHAQGIKTREAIAQFGHAITIGFSATPDFSEHKKLSHILEHEIYEMKVNEAIRSGLLSGAETAAIRTNIDISGVRVTGGEYNEKTLSSAVNKQARNQLAVQVYRERFQGHLAVAYCAGVDHAKSVAEEFVNAGVAAELISGDTPDGERKEILERFQRGETKVLCNAKLLIEGFDEPKASVCLNVAPTLSAVNAEQRGGRVLRLDPNNPDKIGYIIDFLDDTGPIRRNTRGPRRRTSPILYREVLGAVALRSAVSSESASDSKEESGQPEPLRIQGLEVIGTEEEFDEVLGGTRKYERTDEWVRNFLERHKEVSLDFRTFSQEFNDVYGQLLPLGSRNLSNKQRERWNALWQDFQGIDHRLKGLKRQLEYDFDRIHKLLKGNWDELYQLVEAWGSKRTKRLVEELGEIRGRMPEIRERLQDLEERVAQGGAHKRPA